MVHLWTAWENGSKDIWAQVRYLLYTHPEFSLGYAPFTANDKPEMFGFVLKLIWYTRNRNADLKSIMMHANAVMFLFSGA